MSLIPKKRKLDQLKRPNDVDYNSEESARDSSGDSEGLRPRKQQKLHASRKTSPPNRPILDLDSQLPHDGTGRNSGDEKHDNDDHIEDERAVSTTQPASPSLQESTSLRDIEPSHDEVSNGSRNQILDYPVNDLTEEDDDSDNGNDNNDKDEENDEGYDKDEDKAKNYSDDSDGSDGGDNDGDSDGDSSDGDEEGNKAHKHVEQHKPPTSVRGISNPKRAAEHGLQRSRHSPSTSSMRKSDRSTAPTSNHHKRVAPPKHGRRRARKPSFTDSASDSDRATSGAASNADPEEWLIQAVLRRKKNGPYTIEFPLDNLHQLPLPVNLIKQSQKPRPKSKFTAKEDALLTELKGKQNLPWDQIGNRFPGRSLRTLQVHYSTKLKDRTTMRKRRR